MVDEDNEKKLGLKRRRGQLKEELYVIFEPLEEVVMSLIINSYLSIEKEEQTWCKI
jgi:hypothetical protein